MHIRTWLIATILAATTPLVAQETPPDAGAAVETLKQAETSDLEILLTPMTAEDLTSLSVIVMEELRLVSTELAEVLIEQKRTRASGGEADPDMDARALSLFEQKTGIVARVELVLAALKAKGGDVEAASSYVGVARTLAPDDIGASGDQPVEPTPTEQPTEEAAEAAALGKAVAAAIESVRAQPPGHEWQQPWTIPVTELELEMQPLRVTEVEERVKKWLEILQREVRKRIRIDIALQRAEDGAERTELAGRSAEQQEIVKAVVARMETALLILQKRGGDITVYKKYIATATGQKLNLTDPGVLYAQAMAWLRSGDGGIKLGLNILRFLGLLFAFWVLSRILGRAVSTALGRVGRASTLLRSFLVGATVKMTMIIGLVIAVSALGVNVTPLLAAIGAAGLVIGLALQGTLSNFASGILILFYRPYDVGDFISGGGVSGKVESMSLVSTSILTPDNQVLIVPNNQIWNGVITNVTGRHTRRVDLVFGIGYADDIGTATSELHEAMMKHDKVLKDPEPVVKVHELGDNSVNLIARPWVKTSDYWDVYWDLMRDVKERFDEAGLNIPFPQRDLHIPGTIEVKLARDDGRAAKPGHDVMIETQPTQVARGAAAAEAAPAGMSEDGDGDGNET